MNVVADRSALDPACTNVYELQALWQRNEAVGASLWFADLSQPANARAFELFQARRRVLYGHLQAHCGGKRFTMRE